MGHVLQAGSTQFHGERKKPVPGLSGDDELDLNYTLPRDLLMMYDAQQQSSDQEGDVDHMM